MPSDSVLRTNPSAWSRALKHIIDNKLISMRELAEVGECSQRHLYNVANEQAALGHDKAEKISRFAESDYGITSLAETHNTPAFTVIERVFGKANGSTKDEFVKIVKSATQADNSYEEIDLDGLEDAIGIIRAALSDLEEEAAALRRKVA